MKYYVIVTRDIVADVHSIPMFVPNIGSAIRSFGDLCKSKEKGNTIAEHPEDFELIQLGEYDDQDASFNTQERKQIAVGANYRD